MEKVKIGQFSAEEMELFEKYAPCLVFDKNEPFVPLRIGLAIYYRTSLPASMQKYYPNRHIGITIFEYVKNFYKKLYFDRPFRFSKIFYNRFMNVSMQINNGWKLSYATRVLEYAVFYESDIGHIYDLEHVWVYLDGKNQIIGIKATRHGMISVQYPTPASIRYYKGHPIMFVSPGKHSYYTNPSQMQKKYLSHACNRPCTSILDIHFFFRPEWDMIKKHYPGKNTIKIAYQNHYCFEPSFRFTKYMIPHSGYGSIFTPWSDLEKEIPTLLINFLKKISSEKVMNQDRNQWVENIAETGSAPQHHLGGKKATLNLIKQSNIQDRKRILVLGCGSSQTAFSIAKRFDCEIIGTDINPKAIEEVNKQLQKYQSSKFKHSKSPLKGKIQFLVDDIFNSNLKKEYFNYILIESVLIMLPKEPILNILNNLIDNNGLICINEGLRTSADEQHLQLVIDEFKKNGINWSLPTYEEWKIHFRNCNLDVVFDTGPIHYSLIRIGIESFLNHPVQSLKFVLKMVKNNHARRFYIKMQKLMKNAHIKWGYCLWVCKKSIK